jgi:hypothetical protein
VLLSLFDGSSEYDGVVIASGGSALYEKYAHVRMDRSLWRVD